MFGVGMFGRVAAAAVVCCAVALSGCPFERTFQVWITNGSAEFVVISVIVEGVGEPPPMIELIEDEGIQPQTTRVFSDVPLEEFIGQRPTITLTVMGATEPTFDVMVAVEEIVRPGSVFPIALSGDTVNTFAAVYVPIEKADQDGLE